MGQKILTWKLVNRGTTQTKKTSNWVTENPTEYIFFNKILWFTMSNAFCKLIRNIPLWPFVLHPTRCKMAKTWIAYLKFSFLCFFCFVCWVQLSQRFKPNLISYWLNVILFLGFLNNNTTVLYPFIAYAHSQAPRMKKRRKKMKRIYSR